MAAPGVTALLARIAELERQVAALTASAAARSAEATLVTLEMAKQQLRIVPEDTAQDAVVAWKLAQAEDAILRYLKPERTGEVRLDWPWTIATVPPAVQHAILILLTHFFEHRGDDMSPSGAGETPDADVWLAVERVTMQLRDKALA